MIQQQDVRDETHARRLTVAPEFRWFLSIPTVFSSMLAWSWVAIVGSPLVVPPTAARADSVSNRHGDIRDIKHVVILMQENRSFDHYCQLTRANSTVPGSTEIAAGHGDGVYDLTVTGPKRFLRRFTGDVSAAGATAQVVEAYHAGGWGERPKLFLKLINGGNQAVRFTVTPNYYSAAAPRSYEVAPQGSMTHQADPVVVHGGWYDVTITISGDASWSRRYSGYLETGAPSITG